MIQGATLRGWVIGALKRADDRLVSGSPAADVVAGRFTPPALRTSTVGRTPGSMLKREGSSVATAYDVIRADLDLGSAA
jgi:hypothetical protein